MRKIILTVFAASSLLLYSTQAFALFNLSVGVPLSHSFSDANVAESDGVSGTFIQVGVPMLPGIGMDSYKTKLKGGGTTELATMIYNLYYQLPLPIINLTLGAGVGSTELQCTGCSYYDKGTASQWYASLGMPIIPLFDLHLSYRSVSTKIKAVSGSEELDLGGNVTGVGIGFNF